MWNSFLRKSKLLTHKWLNSEEGRVVDKIEKHLECFEIPVVANYFFYVLFVNTNPKLLWGLFRFSTDHASRIQQLTILQTPPYTIHFNIN